MIILSTVTFCLLFCVRVSWALEYEEKVYEFEESVKGAQEKCREEWSEVTVRSKSYSCRNRGFQCGSGNENSVTLGVGCYYFFVNSGSKRTTHIFPYHYPRKHELPDLYNENYKNYAEAWFACVLDNANFTVNGTEAFPRKVDRCYKSSCQSEYCVKTKRMRSLMAFTKPKYGEHQNVYYSIASGKKALEKKEDLSKGSAYCSISSLTKEKGGHFVNLSNGNQYIVSNDITNHQWKDIAQRHYNSMDGVWRFSLERKISEDTDGNIVLIREDGKKYVWEKVLNRLGEINYSPVRSNHFVIEKDKDGWRVQNILTGDIEIFSSSGRLLSLSTNDDKQISFHYDKNGELINLKDQLGRLLTISYDNNKNIDGLYASSGESIEYVWDMKGRLSSVIKGNTQKDYLYGDSHFPKSLTSIVDTNNVSLLHIQYDSYGRVVESSKDGEQEKFQIEYQEVFFANEQNNEPYRIVRVTNPKGKETQFEFALKGGRYNLLFDNESGGRFWKYDRYNKVKECQAEHGLSWAWNRDGLFKATKKVGYSPLLELKWDEKTFLPLHMKYPALEVKRTYDSQSKLLEEQRSDKRLSNRRRTFDLQTRKIKYRYEEDGKLTAIDGAREEVNDTLSLVYDGSGSLYQITNPIGHQFTVIKRNNRGLIEAVKDRNQIITRYWWDAEGKLIQTRRESKTPVVFRYAYNALGLLSKVYLPNGGVQNYKYDSNSRLVQFENAVGEQIRFGYDAAGNLESHTIYDANGVNTYYKNISFDSSNRIESIEHGDMFNQAFNFDAENQVLRYIDGSGSEQVVQYDQYGRVIARQNASYNQVKYEYNLQGNVKSIKFDHRQKYIYQYNAFDELVYEYIPNLGKQIHRYDLAGNKVLTKNSKAEEIRYQYDAINRLTRIETASGKDKPIVIDYLYDEGEYAVGKLVQISRNNQTSIQYAYDDRGNVIKVTQDILGNKYITQYKYNLLNKVTHVLFPSGQQVRYTWGENNRISDIDYRYSDHGDYKSLLSNIVYQPYGRVKSYSFGDKLKRSFEYNKAYFPTKIETKPTDRFHYKYSSRGRIEQIQHNNIVQKYQYDTQGRLIIAGGINYDYDDENNRTLEYGASNQILTYRNNLLTSTQTAKGEKRLFSHDTLGRMNREIRNNATEFQLYYSPLGYLSTVLSDGMDIEYFYDPLGRRVAKQTNGYWAYENLYNKSNQLSSSVRLTKSTDGTYKGKKVSGKVSDVSEKYFSEYIYLDGIRVARIDTEVGVSDGSEYFLRDATYFDLNDHLGTAHTIVNRKGETVWQGAYDPFGVLHNYFGEIENNARLPGQHADVDTGYYYNGRRDYMPRLGRYMQRDPLEAIAGKNAYIYANHDPLRFVDISGEMPMLYAGLSSFISGYLSSGDLKTSAASAIVGGTLGVVRPFASTIVGTYVSQAIDKWKRKKQLPDIQKYNYCYGAGAMLGNAFGEQIKVSIEYGDETDSVGKRNKRPFNNKWNILMGSIASGITTGYGEALAKKLVHGDIDEDTDALSDLMSSTFQFINGNL